MKNVNYYLNIINNKFIDRSLLIQCGSISSFYIDKRYWKTAKCGLCNYYIVIYCI